MSNPFLTPGYVYFNGNSYVTLGITAAQGPQGSPGIGTSIQGPQGSPGISIQGSPGLQGSPGVTGASITGSQGPQGSPGAPGSGSTRPSSDTHTLLDYRFNETVSNGVLVNHGSYGGSTSPVGPAPTTVTANFTQPNAGTTVVVSVASSTGYQASQIILVGSRVAGGGGGNYYYCTAAGSNTITLKNLGIVGSTTVGGTILSGSNLAVNLDILYASGGGYPAILAPGPYDYANSFTLPDFTAPGWCNAYSDSYLAGGCPDFNGLTNVSQHILIKRDPGNYNSNVASQWFGYASNRNWGSPNFYTLGGSIQGDSVNGAWSVVGNGQSFSLTGSPTLTGSGYTDVGVWDLLSVTYDFTITSGAVKMYKNGYLVSTQNTTGTGSLSFGSTGYWYIAAPSYALGDTGDRTYAAMAMVRYENVTRSAAYILSMWNSIVPNSTSWPVP
jgi:hypothetical protein